MSLLLVLLPSHDPLGIPRSFWRILVGKQSRRRAGKAAGGLDGPPVSASSLLPPQNENLVAREAFAETPL